MALAGQSDCAGGQINLREAGNHNQCHRVRVLLTGDVSLRHIGLSLHAFKQIWSVYVLNSLSIFFKKHDAEFN